uniref:von Willebrand factor A domain containing 7 n=1 Tax=Astatotilapia calliptera TaxID=8154 RepID=A0AAX7V698_ASTCA
MLLFSDQSQSLLNEEGPLAVLQQFQGLYRVNLFPPLQPGQWKLQAKSNGHLTFNVIGDSGVDFLYYFAIITNETHPGLARVDGNPTAGVPAFLVVAVTGLGSDEEASFSHATLLGAEGESLQQVKLNSSSSSIYSLEELVGLVDPFPRVPFCIRLSGEDSRGNKLERVSTEMVEPTHIQIQVLSLPDLVPGQSAVVNFEIQNHGAARNFSWTADDDCGYLLMTEPHSFLVAEQRSFRDQVYLQTPATAQAGVTVTLTLTVNDLHSADSNYAVAYLTVVPQDSDTSPPSCSAARVQSNCSAICNATSWSVSLSVSDIGHSGLDALQLQEGEGILILFHSNPTSEDSLGEPGIELQQTQRDKSTNGAYHHHQEQHNHKARLETGGPPLNISEWSLDVSQPLFVSYTSSCCSTQAKMLVWDKAGNMKRCHLTNGQKRQLQNKSTETSGTGQKMPTGFFFLLLGLLCFPLL